MLTYAQLADLERASRDTPVLSAYVDATELDAVARRAWRHSLAGAVVAARKAMAEAPHAERTAYDRAADRLEAQARALSDDLGGAHGWVAFVTADDVRYAGPTAMAPAAALLWRRGIATAPYLRLLRDDPAVAMAVVDVRSADLYRWARGTLVRGERLHAYAHVRRAGHMGDSPHQGFHPGTRGMTLTDAAQRAVDAGADRLVREVAAELDATGRAADWIVVAGNREVALDAIKHLSKGAQKRALYVPGLAAEATDAEIARAAAEGGAELERAREVERVAELLDRAAARGRGVLGYEPTAQALASGAAREVLVTGGFFERAPERAEALMLAVLANGARVVEVAGEAAARLDAECEGVGAALRYRARSGAAKVGVGVGAV